MPKTTKRMTQGVTLELPDGRKGQFWGGVLLDRKAMQATKKEDVRVTLHEPVEMALLGRDN